MKEIEIQINCKALDEAIEKANRLIALLKAAQALTDSLQKEDLPV